MTDDSKHKFGNSITVMARSINARLQQCEDKMIKIPKQAKKKEAPAKDEAGGKATADKTGAKATGDKAATSSRAARAPSRLSVTPSGQVGDAGGSASWPRGTSQVEASGRGKWVSGSRAGRRAPGVPIGPPAGSLQSCEYRPSPRPHLRRRPARALRRRDVARGRPAPGPDRGAAWQI